MAKCDDKKPAPVSGSQEASSLKEQGGQQSEKKIDDANLTGMSGEQMFGQT